VGEHGKIVIRDVRIFDGIGGGLRSGHVVTAGFKIAEVDVDGPPP